MHTDNLVLREISERVICCSLCPRLLSYIKQVGDSKVRRFITEDYGQSPFQVLEIQKHSYL